MFYSTIVNQYTMVNLVTKYLEINKYNDKNEAFESSYLSHPNYPSLYAVTDTLSLLHIENIAARIPKEQFIELPDYFLAVLDGEFVLVHKKEAHVEIETIKGSFFKLSFDDFLNRWNQLVIAVEPNLVSTTKLKYPFSKGYLYILPCIALITVSLFFKSYGLTEFLLLSTSILGLVVSVFIVQEKFGIKNEMATKLCSLNTSAYCDSVIQSEISTINKWLSFSDLPLLFFAISVVAILMQPKNSGIVVGFLSLVMLPVIVYSIWLQKFELKKWCVLCLAVSLLIVSQGLVFGFTTTSFLKILLSVNVFALSFATIVITSLWFLIKPMIAKKLQFEKKVNELKRFKRDFKLFTFLSKTIPQIDGFQELNGIQIGNVNAEVRLTIIISPSCGHCHTAFQEAIELVKNYSERVFLQVLFNINPENKNNPYTIVVETLLSINALFPQNAEEALTDWHVKKMELNQWKEKWAVNRIDTKANQQIALQYLWCLQNKFNYTPVKLINKKLFPIQYEINELKYFLNDFSEEKQVLEDTIAIEA
jgi:uncharacterized membrane protein